MDIVHLWTKHFFKSLGLQLTSELIYRFFCCAGNLLSVATTGSTHHCTVNSRDVVEQFSSSVYTNSMHPVNSSIHGLIIFASALCID